MTRLTLYSGPLSMFGAKVRDRRAREGARLRSRHGAVRLEGGYSPKHPEVLRINPKKQVPVLVHGAVEIFDSTQIFEYLEDIAPSPPLWPRDPSARARARGLEHRSDEVFFPHIIRLMSLQDALETEPAVTAIEAANATTSEMDRAAGIERLARGQLFVR